MAEPTITPEEMARILEALPDAVTLVDPEGRIRYVNRFQEGYDESAIGAHFLDFIPEENREAQAAQLETVMETGEPMEKGLEVLHAEGGREWYEALATPIIGSDGRVSVLVVSRNVTDRVAAEREADALRSLLRVCSWCKRIRHESGEWRSLESYLAETGRRTVTHSMCPDCERRLSGGERGEPGTTG